MADQTRGITCPDMRRVVREALANGWEWVRWTGTTHAEIRWPRSGAVLRFGATPSLASWKSLATDIQKESGIEVWRKGNRKRSRRADDHSDFSLSRCRRESLSWHREWDGEIERLEALRTGAIAECQALAASGRREDLMKMPDLWRRIAEAEERLSSDFHQSVEPFDPHSLAT